MKKWTEVIDDIYKIMDHYEMEEMKARDNKKEKQKQRRETKDIF